MAEEKPNTETPGAEARAPCRARLERIKPNSTFNVTQHLKLRKVMMLLIHVRPKSIAYIQHHCRNTSIVRKGPVNIVSTVILLKPSLSYSHPQSFH